ncbi:hypothetical protein PSm6_55650 [Pseudomonas solani]|uniref:diguanylate cyclase n=2 Tax=Pseudomonas solani TaxID=2731552 RepID=A0ABM7LHV4_9PSED|nr:hypothetical protein PSm6_55650 [Pseudomonas solani]
MSKLSLNTSLSRNPETPVRPLARRMLAWVLLISAINAVLATSVQLYLDYRRDLADLEEHLNFVRDSHLQGLAAAAWNFDRPLVEAQLKGLVGSPWVAAAELRYGRTDEQRLAIGESLDGKEGVKAFPLEYDLGPRTVVVGQLRVLPNLALVYQRTLDRGLIVVLTQGVKAFVFSIALLWLFHWLVTRRLTRLSTLLSGFSPGTAGLLPLVTEEDRRANDELSVLAGTLEDAQTRLDAYQRQEIALREALEDEVARRTLHLDQALLEQQAIFDNSLTGIAFIRQRVILRCNASFEQMFGYGPRELTGKSTRVIFTSDKAFEQEASFFMPVLLRGGTYVGDCELLRKDGRTRWFTLQFKLLDVDDPEQGAVLTLHDITVRRDAEQALERLARLDGLTGIANRRTLDEALRVACRKASRDRSPLSVALLDVDFFKPFNDHYGHAAGDTALCSVADVLQSAMRRPYDLAARYGGEEFAILLPACEDPAPLLEQLRQAVVALAIPHGHSQASTVVSVSIGAVSVSGTDRCEPGDLLATADAMLYRAKEEGRNRVVCQLMPAEAA